jgi:predicted nuclease with RNAse H fold
MRKADKEMHKHGYPVLPPLFPAMEKLTLRAIEIAKKIIKEGVDIIEVHPASNCKALNMPTKNWQKIQQIFINMSLDGDLKTRTFTPHEIDAASAALTGRLHLQGKTELIGDNKEGYIIAPIKSGWRKLQI